MAFMNQEKKAKIVEQLKKVMPRNWKYSLTVHHHSSITLAIMSAPVDLFGLHKNREHWTNGYIQLNEYYLQNQYDSPVLDTMLKIRDAMNTGNWDKSDIQTDYFDVGHYAYIHIGKWDKPFHWTENPGAQFAKRIRVEPTYDQLKARIAELEIGRASCRERVWVRVMRGAWRDQY